MRDDTIPQTVLFPDLFNKPLVATFDQPQASSDGGAILLKFDLSMLLAAVLVDQARPLVFLLYLASGFLRRWTHGKAASKPVPLFMGFAAYTAMLFAYGVIFLRASINPLYLNAITLGIPKGCGSHAGHF